ncbi:LOW QUALITY PROTEIN: asialoglycoprotein receptor 1-like [Mastacembelus armatus]|uniref:LOW QUALITY PROTEIN: asialoglycoprotein receptor 1-like n=1 Tax=Mastacembelus armatus TaxID=205130 RepID=UPI000E46018A|nr:LOW QUALITY PROTEIN: asialoglycoprotein receptor 1-like [Mastacembelus armatus]
MTLSSVFGQSGYLSVFIVTKKKTQQVKKHGDITMTTEYHDDAEDDSSSFWNKESPPVSFSGVSRFRRWLFPALGAAVILVLIIAVGASNAKTYNRLWSMEKSVSNLTEFLGATQQLAEDAAKDVRRMKFAVESNRDELSSVSEALKQLSVLDTLSRTVTKLKCSFERFTNNGSVSGGCCPLGWEAFGSSCYFYSKMSLTWHEAKDWCNGHESHLVILLTDEDWDFVTQHTMGAFHWVGLTDERTGKWEWVNETPYIMNRRRWKPGQPDNWTGHGLGAGTEDCAHLHHDGRLNDLHCSPSYATSARDTTRAAERQEPQNAAWKRP